MNNLRRLGRQKAQWSMLAAPLEDPDLFLHVGWLAHNYSNSVPGVYRPSGLQGTCMGTHGELRWSSSSHTKHGGTHNNGSGVVEA